MKRILATITTLMLVPSTVLASSIGQGSLPKPRVKTPLCLDEKEKFKEKCEIVIDETGVKGPEGHITNVVQRSKEEK